MVLYLLEILSFEFPGSGLFSYITVRAGCSLLTSLILVLAFGPRFVEIMQIKQGNGQPIREDGPIGHLLTKKGTPSMGGLLILSSILLATLIWSDLKNIYVWIILLSAFSFGTLGFIYYYVK